jgi:hypothetical protein
MNPDGSLNTGDGMAFFLARYSDDGGVLNNTGGGGSLGLFNDSNLFNATGDDRVVAVEFDTYQNKWDTSPQHVGIDVNNISSVASTSTYTGMLPDGKNLTSNLRMTATVSYDNMTKLLAVDLEIDGTPYYVNRRLRAGEYARARRFW